MLVPLSRSIAWMTAGTDTMFCALLFRSGHWLVPVIDTVFWAIRSERNHCENIHDYERSEGR